MEHQEIWYFAYGSNLNTARLRGRIGEWRHARKAVLYDFGLTFDSRGYADIVAEPESRVYGAAYLISMTQLEKLDAHEGVHQRVYQRKYVTIDCDGCRLVAVTYEKVKSSPFKAPQHWYLEFILTGLEEHGWERGVVEYIKRIALQQT